MNKFLENKIIELVSNYKELELQLSNPNISAAARIKLSQEFASLGEIVKSKSTIDTLNSELEEAKILLNDTNLDEEMRILVEKEISDLSNKIEKESKNIQILLIPKHKDDEKDAIVELRAGTGGDEAALFSMVLMKMYQKYAEINGWKSEILFLSETNIGGCKEAVVSFSGKNAFAKLKFESGVHRVQRVPTTETSGRIHTSAATVAVLPLVEDVDVKLNPKDLRIDTFRSQGAGGQHVNTTDSAVRITHIPTGIVASCQDEKSQHKNKAKAMKMLIARMYEMQSKEQENERANTRKSQVGTGDRSERVRSYNYPQGRITDHRISLTLYKLEEVLSGESLDEIINPLITADEAERLANMHLT